MFIRQSYGCGHREQEYQPGLLPLFILISIPEIAAGLAIVHFTFLPVYLADVLLCIFFR